MNDHVVTFGREGDRGRRVVDAEVDPLFRVGQRRVGIVLRVGSCEPQLVRAVRKLRGVEVHRRLFHVFAQSKPVRAPLAAERERVADRVAVVVVRAPSHGAEAFAVDLLARIIFVARRVEARKNAVLVGIGGLDHLRRLRIAAGDVDDGRILHGDAVDDRRDVAVHEGDGDGVHGHVRGRLGRGHLPLDVTAGRGVDGTVARGRGGAPRTPRRVGRPRVSRAEGDGEMAVADVLTFDSVVAESGEALHVLRGRAELRFRRRRGFQTIDGAAVRGRDQRLVAGARNGDDLLFGDTAEERYLAVFHLVDAALRTGRQENRSVRAAGDAVRHFVLEFADRFDKTVGIDAIDLAAASGR